MDAHLNIETTDWLAASATQDVFAAIASGGFRARAVGGAVRNTLMKRPVNDIDLATDARPEDVCRLARAKGLSVHETGLQHGTVTVVSQGTPYEVTTLRTDEETDGRHATVAFTGDWTADAARRDFTINALYCNADGTIFDPLNGYEDVIAQRVRFIGDATARLHEDYLRILRFFRFSALFGNGTLDPDGLTAVTAEQAGLDIISAERIRSELLKTLVGRLAVPIVRSMDESGILGRVLGQQGNVDRFETLSIVERDLDVEPDAIRRLASLVDRTPPSCHVVAGRLRLSNAEKTRLIQFGKTSERDFSNAHTIRTKLYRSGFDTTVDLILLDAASGADVEVARAALDIARTWPVPDFPVSGADLLAIGYAAGPKVGTRLRQLENEWIASDFRKTREQLLSVLP